MEPIQPRMGHKASEILDKNRENCENWQPIACCACVTASLAGEAFSLIDRGTATTMAVVGLLTLGITKDTSQRELREQLRARTSKKMQ